MNFDMLSEDNLGNIIKFIKLEDIFNLAKTNKKLYRSVLLHYKFNNYKLLLKLSTEPARLGSDDDFNTVLKNINIDPNIIFKVIIKGNKYQLLKNYLNKIDPSANDNWAIKYASENGYISIVKLLLNLPLERGVDPSAGDNLAIIYASMNGYVLTVKLLLGLPLKNKVHDLRVDPSANYNEAIRFASQNGHTSVVKLLLELPLKRGVHEHSSRVLHIHEHSSRAFLIDPSADDNEAIKVASTHGYLSVVKLLLDLPVERGVDPSADNNDAIRFASENGHTSVVKLLLNLPIERGVDPSANDNSAIQFASENGHTSVVKLLLNLPIERGVDPSVNNNLAIRFASHNGRTSVVKLLADHSNISLSNYPDLKILDIIINNFNIII